MEYLSGSKPRYFNKTRRGQTITTGIDRDLFTLVHSSKPGHECCRKRHLFSFANCQCLNDEDIVRHSKFGYVSNKTEIPLWELIFTAGIGIYSVFIAKLGE